ncbi:MAG: endonuclease/exonuclease/phosphatase family protein [Planctomycetota bacterium]
MSLRTQFLFLLLAAVAPLSAEDCFVRVATFNASLTRSGSGQLISDLSSGSNPQARVIAETIQRVRPDIVLLNEFDFDEDGAALRLFQENYLSVSQSDAEPIEFAESFVAPSNTGVPSGLDLDNDGRTNGPGDAYGFGFYSGQFGMALLSRYPIDSDAVRTFQNFLWKDMPGALLPDNLETPGEADWYTEAELEVVRLSSKSHWDVPIQIGEDVLHVLASHPTPPVFDGAEDRNGRRNHDEIRFWADYVSADRSNYIVDDSGVAGGLESGARFVVLGDLNADPLDGDSVDGAVAQLLDHPLVRSDVVPRSEGGEDRAIRDRGANSRHSGESQFDTADFADTSPGNLRVDYVLPSRTCRVDDARVFWPRFGDPLFRLAGTFPFPGSDHRLVWVDLALESARRISSIAAGDVTESSAVLWAQGEPGDIEFEVARSEEFDVIVRQRSFRVSSPYVPVKWEVPQLQPGTTYVYRVLAGSSELRGRFRTATSARVRRSLRFGAAGSRRSGWGPFAALSDSAERDLDFFVEIGGAIDADSPSPWVPRAGVSEAEDFGRKLTESLSERYGSSTMTDLRRSTAWFATISDDDIAADVAGSADPASDRRFAGQGAAVIRKTERFLAAVDSFLRYQPSAERRFSTGDESTLGAVDFYRSQDFGELGALFVLDGRSFRDSTLDPIRNPRDPGEVGEFFAAAEAKGRSLLGARQLERLQSDLRRAQENGVVWKFVCLDVPLQDLGLFEVESRYQGYAGERQDLLRFVFEEEIDNVVFIATGAGGAFVNELFVRDPASDSLIASGAIEITTGPVAGDTFGSRFVDWAAENGLVSEDELTQYDSALGAGRDAIVEALLNGQISRGDALGLREESGAELLSGSFAVSHAFSWSELEVDETSLALRVTTRGVASYDEEDIRVDPCAVVDVVPIVLSDFVVPASRRDDPPPLGFELSFAGPDRILHDPAGVSRARYELELRSSAENGVEAWTIGVATKGAQIDSIAFEESDAADHLDRSQGFARHELTPSGAIAAVVLSTAGGAALPATGRVSLASLDVRVEAPASSTFEISTGSGVDVDGETFELQLVAGGSPLDATRIDRVVSIELLPAFRRGDSNVDGRRSITDAVQIFGYLFRGVPQELACNDASDSDDSGSIDVTDGIAILQYLFVSGSPHPDPFDVCGADPTPDTLDCGRVCTD